MSGCARSPSLTLLVENQSGAPIEQLRILESPSGVILIGDVVAHAVSQEQIELAGELRERRLQAFHDNRSVDILLAPDFANGSVWLLLVADDGRFLLSEQSK